jgi:adenosylmethionine-8-amino-7-oxononanoate aminotransferase
VTDELRRIDAETVTRELAADLSSLASRLASDGLVSEVTGRGCFVGLGIRDAEGDTLSGAEVLRIVSIIAQNGVLVHPGPSAIQLIPAYGFDADELLRVDLAVREGLGQTREMTS